MIKIFLRKNHTIENKLKQKITSHQKHTTYDNISEDRFCFLHAFFLSATHSKKVSSIDNKKNNCNSEKTTNIFKNSYNGST
mgnify:CR=1 FL=1